MGAWFPAFLAFRFFLLKIQDAINPTTMVHEVQKKKKEKCISMIILITILRDGEMGLERTKVDEI